MIGGYAFDGPAVVIPAKTALRLAYAFKISEIRVDVRGRDRELDAVLSSWVEVAAIEQQRLVGTVSGIAMASEVPGSGSSDVMGTRAVSALSGVSERGIRKAVERGTLSALPRDGHALRFCAEDVGVWLAGKAEQ